LHGAAVRCDPDVLGAIAVPRNALAGVTPSLVFA
jgi:hypothetical protein